MPPPFHRYNVDYVYCWHGLPAYWNGVMPNEPGMLPLQSRVLFPRATPGVEEIEPSMAWNPAVLAGAHLLLLGRTSLPLSCWCLCAGLHAMQQYGTL